MDNTSDSIVRTTDMTPCHYCGFPLGGGDAVVNLTPGILNDLYPARTGFSIHPLMDGGPYLVCGIHLDEMVRSLLRGRP